METMHYTVLESLYLDTPIGGLLVEIQEHGLSRLSFAEALSDINHSPRTPLGHLAYNQLLHYFDKPHDQFTIPLLFSKHSSFRHRVWQAMLSIKVGRTTSYLQLAQKLNSHPRAIGTACRANPIPIIIPCHRVIAQCGTLCGYTGPGGKQDLRIKAWLLHHEGAEFNINTRGYSSGDGGDRRRKTRLHDGD